MDERARFHYAGKKRTADERRIAHAMRQQELRERYNYVRGYYNESITTRLIREGYEPKQAREVYFAIRDWNKTPFKPEWCQCRSDFMCMVHYLDTLRERVKGWSIK